ncbi:triose-phosphate isomerase family protein [Lichenicoccus sp.]|uniref:triose-phosphate isomerase family protein n=1 Tax=Lichenicoccus sp. TaxID=2781899 RepID=UPI003D0A30EB
MAQAGPLIGVSLKMYMGLARTRAWMTELAAMMRSLPLMPFELFVIPSFLSIGDAVQVLDGVGVAVGAQDVFWEDAGAYTGEVSAPMLVEAGCSYVEIGHAERRALFGETDADVALKVKASVRAGLIPVLCVGEVVEAGPEEAIAACAVQIDAALDGIPADSEVVIAYEPVWAIGAPEPAGAPYIRAVAQGLRRHLEANRNARLIYGGSAGPGLLSRLDGAVDGLFLGRFAHDISALREVLMEAGTRANNCE